MSVPAISAKQQGPAKPQGPAGRWAPGGLGLGGLVRGWWAELKTNRRAALGLLVILVLIAGFGLTLLHNATLRLRAAYDQEVSRLQRIAAVAEIRDWPDRAKTSGSLRAERERRLWIAESEGVARADIQDWIGAIGREVGLPVSEVRIELAKPKSLPPDLRQITATISAQPSETAVLALLDRLERAPHLIVVDRLNVKQQPGPLLEMVLVAYARIAPAGGVASGIRAN
jgi:hypothetical protein